MVRYSQWHMDAASNIYVRPYVQEANELAPTFARIFREMVILTESDKPLPRAAKGNVIRKVALDAYADAIEQA